MKKNLSVMLAAIISLLMFTQAYCIEANDNQQSGGEYLYPKSDSTAVIDSRSKLIYGLKQGISKAELLNQYIETAGDVDIDISDVIGTGTELNVCDASSGAALDSYTALIIGDVNGDGCYNGMDSITVKCLSSSLISGNDLEQETLIAADCNQNGQIDESDYEAERAKAVIVTDIVRTDDNHDGTVTLFAEHSASAKAVGNEILQHGIIYTTDAAQKDNLTLDNANVQKAAASKTNNKLCGLLRKTIEVEENEVVYAVTYLVDANGNTTYGDVKTIVTGSFETSGYDLGSFNCATFDSALAQADEIIPTAEEITEPEAPTFMSILMNILNVIFALFNSIIVLF